MIEKQVTAYLNERLSVPAYMGEEPKKKPASYVVLQMIDNGRSNQIDAATFNIKSYAATLQGAAELNATIKGLMYDIISEDNISASRCGGGGQSINTGTKAYSYECVFNLFYTED